MPFIAQEGDVIIDGFANQPLDLGERRTDRDAVR
jgi:hypothetical protein